MKKFMFAISSDDEFLVHIALKDTSMGYCTGTDVNTTHLIRWVSN